MDFVDRGFFCGSCKTHLLSGYECDYCTLKVDEVTLIFNFPYSNPYCIQNKCSRQCIVQVACARSIADKITCKTVQKPDNDGNFKHHWVGKLFLMFHYRILMWCV